MDIRRRKIGDIKTKEVKVKPKKFNSAKKRRETISNVEMRLLDKKKSDKRFVYRKKKGVKKTFSLVFTVIIGLVASFLVIDTFFVKAVIEIVPKSYSILLKDTYPAYQEPKEEELGYRTIVLTHEEEEEFVVERYDNVSLVSSYMVVLSNELDKAQRLLPNTRLESTGGLLYKTGDKEVVIPAADSSGPGEISVVVNAIEPGEKYNISVGDRLVFSAWKEAGDPRVDSQYGVIQELIQEGMVGKVPVYEGSGDVVSDLKDTVREVLLERADSSKHDGFYMIPVVESLDFEPEGVEVMDEKVRVSVIGSITLVVFSEDELINYLGYYKVPGYDLKEAKLISSNMDLKIASLVGENIFESPAITFSVSGEARIVGVINTDEVRQMLVSADKERFEEIMSKNPQVFDAGFYMRPFWRKELPGSVGAIEVHVLDNLNEEVVPIE